jgi:hypothetical protein
VRPVGPRDGRLKVAAKLGFGRGVRPPRRAALGAAKRNAAEDADGLKVTEIGHLDDLLNLFGLAGDARAPRGTPGQISRPRALSRAADDHAG